MTRETTLRGARDEDEGEGDEDETRGREVTRVQGRKTKDWDNRGAVTTKIKHFATASGEWAMKGKEQWKLISKAEGRP